MIVAAILTDVDGNYLPAWPDHVNPIELWDLTFAGKTFQNGPLFFDPKDLLL
jgi:hypothetical protein